MNKLKDEYLRKIALRNAKIRWWVKDIGISKASAGRMFNLSRERVRQIVDGK